MFSVWVTVSRQGMVLQEAWNILILFTNTSDREMLLLMEHYRLLMTVETA